MCGDERSPITLPELLSSARRGLHENETVVIGEDFGVSVLIVVMQRVEMESRASPHPTPARFWLMRPGVHLLHCTSSSITTPTFCSTCVHNSTEPCTTGLLSRSRRTVTQSGCLLAQFSGASLTRLSNGLEYVPVRYKRRRCVPVQACSYWTFLQLTCNITKQRAVLIHSLSLTTTHHVVSFVLLCFFFCYAFMNRSSR